ncbi:MAG: hypothetical protein UV59_C0019G0004 [Candidatus Gottesmanbacteria bacterium GW2011_GWA1_43_11]|uniref:Uncharacterized protein n=1 Tax=Candidatus Gottesmanbacteria bacterium GW2011_GWA1_43_11 TaxID=1618436 RepID=A0A0G1CG26_9BACT|nr:MAG: hypothetical protein UV59_C0019G0004 [Candidatus Gottesmanbacteria bacterium GW2011_GWA1_43_11]
MDDPTNQLQTNTTFNAYTPQTTEPVDSPAAQPPPPFMTDIPAAENPPPKKSNKFLVAAIVLLLIITIPFVVYVAQQQQDIRQRAQTYCNNGNPNATTHRECQNGLCVTVNNAAGVCDLEDNNTCDTNSQCTSGGSNNGGNNNGGNNTGGTNVTASPSPSPSASPSPSPSPVVNCNVGCSSSTECNNANLVCYVAAGQTTGFCRNPSCPTSANDTNNDCNCESTISTTQQSQSPAVTPQVPKAGTMWPTVFVVIGGIVLLGLGLAL